MLKGVKIVKRIFEDTHWIGIEGYCGSSDKESTEKM
jgi:hypothetical protein